MDLLPRIFSEKFKLKEPSNFELGNFFASNSAILAWRSKIVNSFSSNSGSGEGWEGGGSVSMLVNVANTDTIFHFMMRMGSCATQVLILNWFPVQTQMDSTQGFSFLFGSKVAPIYCGNFQVSSPIIWAFIHTHLFYPHCWVAKLQGIVPIATLERLVVYCLWVLIKLGCTSAPTGAA